MVSVKNDSLLQCRSNTMKVHERVKVLYFIFVVEDISIHNTQTLCTHTPLATLEMERISHSNIPAYLIYPLIIYFSCVIQITLSTSFSKSRNSSLAYLDVAETKTIGGKCTCQCEVCRFCSFLVKCNQHFSLHPGTQDRAS